MGQGQTRAPLHHFVNEPNCQLEDAWDGFVWATPGLQLLEGFPDTKVMVRSDWTKDRVAIVAVGGAGHEPSDVGFMGRGLLTAVSCGDVFTPPTAASIVDAIAAVTGPAGCLLLSRNYLSHRLNCSIAVGIARTQGLSVMEVCVADDIAGKLSCCEESDVRQSRGIAGGALVTKVAGAAAEAGLSLEEVHREAQATADKVWTLGICFDSCSMPGRERSRMHANEMEIGLGIHGEPGLTRWEADITANELVNSVVQQLQRQLPPEGDICVLLNNLGAVPMLEMMVLCKALMISPIAPRVKLLIGPVSALTSLNTNGISISVCPLDALREERLCTPVACRHWAEPVRPQLVPKLEKTELAPRSSSPGVHSPPSHSNLVEVALRQMCRVIVESVSELDKIESCVGNGNCGHNLGVAAQLLLEALNQKNLPLAHPGHLFWRLSEIFRASPGALPTLLGIYFSNVAEVLTDCNKWDRPAVVKALQYKIDVVHRIGHARPGMRSFLDALVPALESASDGADWAAVARAAARGAHATATMGGAVGRAAYVPEALRRGILDAGAVAVSLAISAMARPLMGRLGWDSFVSCTNDEVFWERFERGRLIGEGSFGKVYAAHTREVWSFTDVVVKITEKEQEEAGAMEFLGCDILQQHLILLWLGVSKPNIVHMLEVCVSPERTYYVMESLSGPNLEEWLSSKTEIQERLVAILVKQMLSAVREIHAADMVHRDIKPENFVFANVASLELKLVDVVGTMCGVFDNARPQKLAGTPLYVPPEVLEHLLTKGRLDTQGIKAVTTKAVDMWAIGVTVFQMLSGKVPFEGSVQSKTRIGSSSSSGSPKNRSEVAKLARAQSEPLSLDGSETWELVSHEAKDFLRSLLRHEPEHRLCVEDALAHPWFAIDTGSDNPIQRNSHVACSPLRDFFSEKGQTEHVVRKTLFLVRHGEAVHNIEEQAAKKVAQLQAEQLGLHPKSPECKAMVDAARRLVLNSQALGDAELSPAGKAQALATKVAVAALIRQGKVPEPTGLLISPLQRTLQTASIIFPNHPNAHVRDLLSEKKTQFPCDNRSKIRNSVRKTFVNMSFSHLDRFDEQRLWFDSLEAEENNADVRERAATFVQQLRSIRDDCIALVSHKGFLRELERGPFGQPETSDAKKPGSEFGNCEVRVYDVTLAPRGVFATFRYGG